MPMILRVRALPLILPLLLLQACGAPKPRPVLVAPATVKQIPYSVPPAELMRPPAARPKGGYLCLLQSELPPALIAKLPEVMRCPVL